MIASFFGLTGIVSLLRDQGACLDERDDEGLRPLLLAAEQGYDDVVKLLLETRKVNVEDSDNFTKRTALHRAVIKDYIPVVKVVLGVGKANIMAKDAISFIALRWSIKKRTKNGIDQLLLEAARSLKGCDRRAVEVHLRELGIRFP